MEKLRKRNTTWELAKELLGDFVNLLFGQVWNKVGLSLLLIVLGLVFILSPIVGHDGKPLDTPISHYIIGSTLLVTSVILIVTRWTELKKKNNR